MVRNAEIKARCADAGRIRTWLQQQGADFKGTDEQVDVYFIVPAGGLKVRRGTFDRPLIYYQRADTAATKESQVQLLPLSSDSKALHDLLEAALGIRCVVSKRREIYFIGNVKFHLDEVEGLGSFVEIEAIDRSGTGDYARIHAQCEQYRQALQIAPADLLTHSYSDMLTGQA